MRTALMLDNAIPADSSKFRDQNNLNTQHACSCPSLPQVAFSPAPPHRSRRARPQGGKTKTTRTPSFIRRQTQRPITRKQSRSRSDGHATVRDQHAHKDSKGSRRGQTIARTSSSRQRPRVPPNPGFCDKRCCSSLCWEPPPAKIHNPRRSGQSPPSPSLPPPFLTSRFTLLRVSFPFAKARRGSAPTNKGGGGGGGQQGKPRHVRASDFTLFP